MFALSDRIRAGSATNTLGRCEHGGTDSGFDTANEDGTTEEWMVEGGSPNSLLRLGLTRDSIPIGTELVVDGYQARDPSLLRANGRNITFPDGRQLLLGTSAPDR